MKVGDVFGPAAYPVTREMLARYAEASGDHNPIHLDPEFATSVGLPDTIAHGMLTMGLAASALHSWFGSCTAVTEFGTRFTKPVVVPEAGTTVIFTATISEDLGDGRFAVDLTATCDEVKVLGMCKAVVSP
jgi:acyl dehydratase